MGDAHAHTPAAIAVLDIIPTPGGGGYVASELVTGSPLDEVARRRAPLPASEAAGYGVELLDAVITLRRHVPGAERAVVGSALVGTDGRIRVTRFSRPARRGGRRGRRGRRHGGDAARPAERLPPARHPRRDDRRRPRGADRHPGGDARPPPHRGHAGGQPTVVAPPPPVPEHKSRWPWIIAAILVVLAAAIAIGIFLATRDDEGAQQATVPDVVGFTQDAAVNAVSDAGFSPQTKEGASDKVAEGLVISTTPPGGEQADTGSRVTITVSQGNGNVSVPTVIGVTQEEAVAVLQQAGLKSRVIEQPSATAPGGRRHLPAADGGPPGPEGLDGRHHRRDPRRDDVGQHADRAGVHDRRPGRDGADREPGLDQAPRRRPAARSGDRSGRRRGARRSDHRAEPGGGDRGRPPDQGGRDGRLRRLSSAGPGHRAVGRQPGGEQYGARKRAPWRRCHAAPAGRKGRRVRWAGPRVAHRRPICRGIAGDTGDRARSDEMVRTALKEGVRVEPVLGDLGGLAGLDSPERGVEAAGRRPTRRGSLPRGPRHAPGHGSGRRDGWCSTGGR